MLTYKGKELTKFKNKNGGKNKNELDGFYRDTDGAEFFIKKPNDLRELFAELFAGFLLEEFKKRGLIPQSYHNSFICADFIQFEDGSYGLIQPRVSFRELHQIIGTSYKDGSDRDPFTEMFLGPDYYPLLTQIEKYFGLSIVLLFSLLLGDYSVHSANIVCLETLNKAVQFARIDLGAAFRNFGYKENNINILNPLEYQGLFNVTGFTKGYLLNYKKITGLFPAIAARAKNLINQANNDLFVDIISTVLRKIPADLVNETSKKKLTQYLGIPSFYEVSIGTTANNEQFCLDFAEILTLRLQKISDLKDLSPENNKLKFYRSQSMEDLTEKVPLLVDDDLSFPAQLEIWQHVLMSETNHFDARSINLAQLVQQFHVFRDLLLKQEGAINHAGPSSLPGNSVSQDNTNAKTPQVTGCVETNLLQQLFTLNSDATPRFADSQDIASIRNHKDLYWSKIANVLSSSFHVIITIRVWQETQKGQHLESAEDYAIAFLLESLKDYLNSFHDSYQLLPEYLESCPPSQVNYPVDSLGEAPSLDRKVLSETFFFSHATSKEDKRCPKSWCIKDRAEASATNDTSLLKIP